MRFSIIIPVYNVERYIRRCMDSLMKQTFDDFEVIVVDDETPDNSMAIVQEFVEQFPDKIRTVRQKNTRQGGARNRGVNMARGEYILFADSDDYVSTDLLQTVDAYLRHTPADILVFRFTSVTESGRELDVAGIGELKPGLYTPMSHEQLLSLSAAPWNKVYRSSFYRGCGMQFPEKLLYEDGMTNLLYASAKTILVCPESLYYYVQSENSSIRQKPSERMLDIITVNGLLKEAFARGGMSDSHRDYLECLLLKSTVYIMDIINEADHNCLLQQKLADYIRKEFPNCLENGYIDRELRNKLEWILAGRFRQYHWNTFVLRKIKNQMLKSAVISRLNAFRLSIRDRKG